MATLFGDDGGSIFAARKAMQKKTEEQPKPQETRQKRSKPKFLCIYQTNVTVQTVNQSTNQTNNIGNCFIGVYNNGNDFIIRIIDSKSKEIANIQINVETRWKYNNSKQCSTYGKTGLIILDFPNESTTQIFSIFAVLAKVQKYNGVFPVKIEGSAQSSSCPIHYLSVDISKQAISPQEVKDDYIPPQETIQAQFANNNAPGSAGVYMLSSNIFAFIQVLERTEASIEETDEEQGEVETTEVAGEEEEEIIYEEEVVYEEEPEIDSEKIITLQNEVRLRLNQLSLMIKSLRPNPIPIGKITVSNVTLLHDIRCAITAAKQKDQAIEKLQSQIDKFGDTLTQIREKEEMKKMIEKIKDDIASFKEVEEESENLQKEKRKTIEKLNAEIQNAQIQLKKSDEELLADEFENIKKLKMQMQAQLKKEAQLQRDSTDTLAVLREQVVELGRQNEELRARAGNMPSEGELEREKAEAAARLKEAVQKVAVGTLQLVQSNLKEGASYSGAAVRAALQTILQRVNNRVLGVEEEDQGENEEEEEAGDNEANEGENEEDENEGENGENDQGENEDGENNENENDEEAGENEDDQGENENGENEDDQGENENGEIEDDQGENENGENEDDQGENENGEIEDDQGENNDGNGE